MIAAVASPKKEIESQLQSNIETRFIPGVCEEYIENLVKTEIEEAQIEALFKIIDAEQKNKENEELKEESVFEGISFNLWTLESILSNHMWIIALAWLILSGVHWLVGVRFISAKGSLLTKPASPPIPFFPNYSRGIVDDHYFGNNAAPEDLLRRSEIAILMYYAPWSLHAMETRKPFIEVATSFQFIPTVKFSAVNCNTKYGKCKKSFKLYSYPVIVGYVGNTHIQYIGPRTSTGIFNFVRHLLKPIVKVTDIRELKDNFDEYKYLVIGFFPFTSHNTFKEYTTYIATALKSGSNFDKFGSTRFIMIQNPDLARELELDWTHRIRVYSNYENVGWKHFGTSFTVTKTTISDDILDWIEKKVDRENKTVEIEWIHLENLEAGGKSESLFKYLNDSAVAILFTTDYEGFAESKSMKILRNVVKSYFDCGEQEAKKYEGTFMDLERMIDAQGSCGQVHGPSAAVAYILHSVASYFRGFDGLIKFYKIDTLKNELPYQYSFERVPALMFFPARDSDSSRYPNELPFTVPNILAFVLSRCQPELRWRIALSSCSSACIERNRFKLKQFSSSIEEDLRKLRIMRFHESRKMKMASTTRLNFLRIAIQRRVLQKKASLHLDNVLHLLESGNRLDKDREDEVIRDSLFVRWLLYNHFGLNYSK